MERRQEATDGVGGASASPNEEGSTTGIRGVHTELHARASRVLNCETVACVRSETVAVIQSTLGHDAVGFYECDGDQFVATHRSEAFERYGGPASVDDSAFLTEVVEMGRPRISDDTGIVQTVDTVCAAPTGYGEVVVCPFVSVACLGDRFRTHLNEIATVAGTALYRVEDGERDPPRSTRGDQGPEQRTRREEGRDFAVDSDDSDAETPVIDETLPRETVLDALDESFPDYAFLHDEAGRYLDVLLGDRNIGQTTREAIVDSTVHDVLDPEAADRVLDSIRTAIATNETQSVEYAVETGDTPRHYEALVSALALDDRDAAILVARDVTERRRQREQLRRQNQRLEEVVSIVSHDLRNPLNTAQGYLGMVRSERDDDRLETADRALDRMSEITEQILTFVAHEDADLSLELISVESVVDHCWELTETERATLAVAEEFSFRADRASLRHLFENLFRNAVDHCEGSVTVRVGQTDEGFYVADDGPGIPESERETVFESGHTSAEDGSGIGLAVVETVADAHGWDVSVCDSWAGGARFEFTGVEVVEREREQSDLFA
ncbi:MAG: sensor histidine kinase [Halobaculum sp.]